MTGILLKTTGELEQVEIDEQEQMFRSYRDIINCDIIDIVRVTDGGIEADNYCMIVDDEGMMKEHPEINPYASWFFGVRQHGEIICGDALLLKEIETEEGRDVIGLTDEEISRILLLSTALMHDVYKAIKLAVGNMLKD